MNIGLVAHDSKKTLMQNFCIAYRGILSKHELYATGTTGRLIEEVTNLNVHKYLAGPLGGKEQLGAQIAMVKLCTNPHYFQKKSTKTLAFFFFFLCDFYFLMLCLHSPIDFHFFGL